MPGHALGLGCTWDPGTRTGHERALDVVYEVEHRSKSSWVAAGVNADSSWAKFGRRSKAFDSIPQQGPGYVRAGRRRSVRCCADVKDRRVPDEAVGDLVPWIHGSKTPLHRGANSTEWRSY